MGTGFVAALAPDDAERFVEAVEDARLVGVVEDTDDAGVVSVADMTLS
jgi:phosphoribosylaminoimidazole (AIR) synthetase